ncbi:unnamed protein product [Prorocentrum cordatum]|uniref:Amino acid transporter transmembrane domain-containing protein n=1 Tax=Prorocentrum cordatum TaxID=2364126 RepID=A0ABN9T6D2_9DINO|nr:unnamed protein product [Polarella glacialis]
MGQGVDAARPSPLLESPGSPSSWPSPTAPLPRQIPPLDERHAIGAGQAGLALFKAIVGPGILFLPAGVKNAGLASAWCISAVVGLVSTWCMLLVLDTARHLRCRGQVVADFGDIGAAAFGPPGRLAVASAIVVAQMGFCTAYCVFVAENVQSVISRATGGFELHGGTVGRAGHGEACDLAWPFSDWRLVYLIILVLVPLIIPGEASWDYLWVAVCAQATALPTIPLTWVRQIRFFTLTNLLASVLVLASAAYMLTSFCVQLAAAGVAEGVQWFALPGTCVYFGTAAYAFEGIGVLLPIENSMAEPNRLPAVVCYTLGGTSLLQIAFAGTAYLLYGESTSRRDRSIVTLSLSSGPALGGIAAVELVQVAWILEVLLTFPLQLFPAAGLVEPACFRGGSFRQRRSGRKWTNRNAIRAGLLLICVAVAMGGYTSVDNLVALIGALGCVPLAMPDSACAVLMAVVLAIRSWVSSTFEFQQCVLRPSPPGCALQELCAYRSGLGADGVLTLLAAAARAPRMRSASLVGNAQHTTAWLEELGAPAAELLRAPAALRVATFSCPERELQAAKKLFDDLPVRVILVPNEQNNYNRALFLGH